MADFRRDPLPRAVVWEHFDPPRYGTHKTFHYWLAVDEPADGMRIEARWTGENQVDVKAAGTTRLTVLLNDRLADLAKPVVVKVNGREAFRGAVPPSLSAIVESLDAKEDPKLLFTARVDLAW